MKHYQNYIFDLYGTLIDIWTDEEDPRLWRNLADLYSRYGADYSPEALQVAYSRIVREELDSTRQLLGVNYADIAKLRYVTRPLLLCAAKKISSCGSRQ